MIWVTYQFHSISNVIKRRRSRFKCVSFILSCLICHISVVHITSKQQQQQQRYFSLGENSKCIGHFRECEFKWLIITIIIRSRYYLYTTHTLGYQQGHSLSTFNVCSDIWTEREKIWTFHCRESQLSLYSTATKTTMIYSVCIAWYDWQTNNAWVNTQIDTIDVATDGRNPKTGKKTPQQQWRWW